MTNLERRMIDALKLLRDSCGAEGVKAEFEAEGTRTEEMMTLKEIALKAGVGFALKVGGCEAIRDMHDARFVGVDCVVGPMVESPFALKKYVDAIELVFSEDERKEIDFLINVETIDTIESIDELYSCEAFGRLDGIVLGRGDLVESMGLPRSEVDCGSCLELTRKALRKAKDRGKTTVMGGSITAASIDFIRAIPEEALDMFETRKVYFRTAEALRRDPVKAIEQALAFELMWLENKRERYGAIALEDDSRIKDLNKRIAKTRIA